jgi:hypothetical protein
MEGVTECGDCLVKLVPERPADLEPRYQELVTVYELPNANALSVAESILQAAGIPYTVQNEISQLNVIVGTPYIQVPPEHVEKAKRLLADLESAAGPGEQPEE